MKNTTRKIRIKTHTTALKHSHKAHKTKVTHNYNERTAQKPTTTMYTDIQNSTPTEQEKKAKQSYYADILWTLLNFAFLGVWLYQINSEGEVTIFDD
jgi:hypothetical protein